MYDEHTYYFNLDETVIKIKELSLHNISSFVNSHLKHCLFEKGRWRILAAGFNKRYIEDDEHAI